MKILKNIEQKLFKAYNRIEKYLGLGIAIVGFCLFVGFAESSYNKKTIKDIAVIINSPENHRFLVKKDIYFMIRDHYNNELKGKAVTQLSMDSLEHQFTQNPFVENVEVYNNIKGQLFINVDQRNPVLRVFTENNESFYLDEDGQKMPTSYQYTARVHTARGSIPDKTANIEQDTSKILSDLYKLVNFIKDDQFLNSLIGEIQVSSDKEVTLIPRIGKQEIILGEVEELDYRFRNLKAFYRKVLPKKGWYHYKSISLKFEDQIIAKK